MYTSDNPVEILEIDEETALLGNRAKTDGAMVTACNIFGAVTTCMAMVPQGIFGALLTDKILLQLNKNFNGQNIPLLIVRIGIDGIIFITAEEGKRRLVRFFNTETFKNYGRVQWWKNNFLTPWSVYDVISFIINAGFTVVASSVFAGLAAISFEGIAGLLKNYQSHTTDEIAKWITSYYVTVPFMVTTFISNIPFFPTVHKSALDLLHNALKYLIENPKFRHQKQIIIDKIQAAQLHWKRINEENNEVAKQNFLALYNAEHMNLAQKLIQLGQATDKKLPKESWIEFLIKHSVAISLTGIGITGLYNFLTMTNKVAAIFHIEKAAPVLRWMDYTSMSAVAFSSIYPMSLTFTNYVFFKRNYSVNLISNASYLWILISAVLVCLLGGAPNAYQSVMAQEHLLMIIIAAVDSLLMETYGYYQLTKSNKIIELSEKDENVAEVYKIDSEIENTLNHVTTTASAEEISQLSETGILVPQYRPGYYSIKNCLPHCFLGANRQSDINHSDIEAISSFECDDELKNGYTRIN